MTLNKSLFILKTFNDEKLKLFHAFLSSPYLNNRKILISLYDYILTYSPDFEDYMFEQTYIIKSTIDEKLKDHKYLIKMLSFLYKELESFIIYEDIKNDELQSNIRLLKYYNNNHLDHLYDDTLKTVQSKLKNQTETSSIHYFVNENLCAYKSKYDDRKGDINYINTINSLHIFYLYNNLKLNCLMLNRSLIVNFSYHKFLEENNTIINIPNNIVNPSIQLYSKLQHLLTNKKSKDDFNDVLLFLNEFESAINEEDLGITYTILSNLCKYIFADKKEYYSILFDLYKLQIEKKTIYVESKLRITMIKNIILLSIYNNEFNWAIDFLEKNKNNIIPEEKDHESYNYLLSEIYFAKKDFDKSLEFLSKTKSNDNLIRLSIKRLFLKIFLEKEEINTFDSHTNSYKVFLSRDESLTNEKRDAEKNFVNTMILINRYKLSKNTDKLKSLLKKIEEENISDKKYLQEYIQILIK